MIAYEKSKTSLIESDSIGDKKRTHNFVHIMKEAAIGTECNICDDVFIEDGVVIGNRVTIKNMVQIWRGVVIRDDSFIGPSVVFTNDEKRTRKSSWVYPGLGSVFNNNFGNRSDKY